MRATSVGVATPGSDPLGAHAELSPGPVPYRPPLSVIVPVRNDPENLEICLRALTASDYPAFEVIVVDDASTDATPEVARRHGARLIRQETRSGPGAARNRAAGASRHPYLVFLDADVRVEPDTLMRVGAHLAADPSVDALFGSYDAEPSAPGFLSQYRNLLHHYTHQTGSEEAFTFWSGCGAIKKDVFLEHGGFDAGYSEASIEDIELGGRLRRAGHRITLVKNIQVTHLKRWTLWQMVRCDVQKRGVPWTRLILSQGRIPNDLNLRYGQRLSVLLAGTLVVTLLAAPWLPGSLRLWALAAALVQLLGIGLLNRRFHLFLARAKGPLFPLLALPLHVLYYLCSGFAFAVGLAQHVAGRLRPDSR